MGDLEKLGPTGEFPDGKLNAQDEGGLRMAIGRDAAGNVVLNFGEPIAWVAMAPAQAGEFALTMLSHAGAQITVNVDDAMIQRAREFAGPAIERESDDWIRNLLNFALHGTRDEA